MLFFLHKKRKQCIQIWFFTFFYVPIVFWACKHAAACSCAELPLSINCVHTHQHICELIIHLYLYNSSTPNLASLPSSPVVRLCYLCMAIWFVYDCSCSNVTKQFGSFTSTGLGRRWKETEIWHGNCFLLLIEVAPSQYPAPEAMLVQACSSPGYHWNLLSR
jgi:hypothetical protein